MGGSPRTGGAPGRGIPITFTRQSTSREILDLNWHYPVASKFADHVKDGQTSAAAVERALPREVAFIKISETNRKPLLVLRECNWCKGTEHALFSRTLNNEKTMLLAQWFHCVKLPPNVLNKKHAFRKVFAGEKPPHVFISLSDGSQLIPFDGHQAQSALWNGMTKLINIAYEKKPKPAIKAMLKYLSHFDMLDAMAKEISDRIEKEREKSGPNSSKVKKLRKKLAKLQADKAKTMKLAKAVCDLKLKVVKAKVAAPKERKSGG